MSPSHLLPSCFHPSSEQHHHPPPPPPVSGNPNLTTCLYHTHLGVFSLIWSRTFLGHSLHLYLHSQEDYYRHSSPLSLSNNLSLSSTFTFNLNIRPFTFWRRYGSKRITPKIQVFWDLTRAKFGSGPEPRSRFYIAVVVDGEMGLLVGDCTREAYAKTRAEKQRVPQALVLRGENVFGNRVFSTTARFGGRDREISMDCRVDEDARLCISVDDKRVLQIKRLRWKFRGNQRIEVDGVPIQISWDVYDWLFEKKNKKKNSDRHAVFMFRFENQEVNEEEGKLCSRSMKKHDGSEDGQNGDVLWQQNSCSFGIGGTEWRKMRRSFLRSASSSSISMSSASSGCRSSVLEWASSADEAELGGTTSGGGHGLSLLICAWRK